MCHVIDIIATEVYGKHESRFNIAGQILPTELFITDEVIKQGLAQRLHNYALKTMDSAGFKGAVSGWKVTVYTSDASDPTSDRAYCVRWENQSGGAIKVVGIFTRKGWPFIDHGFAIDR